MALLGLVVVLALIGAGSVVVWVMTGPKSLAKFTPYIEKSLNPPGAPYQVKVGEAMFYWEGWNESLDFRLKQVRINTPEGVQLLQLPEISVELDMKNLLHMKIVPTSIVLRRPSLRLNRDESGELFMGFGDDEQRVPVKLLLAGLESQEGKVQSDSNNLAGSIQFLSIQHAHLKFGTVGEPVLFDAPDINALITREKNAIKAVIDLSMEYNDSISQLNAEVRVANQKQMAVIKADLVNFSTSLLAKLFPAQPQWASLDLPFSGWADIAVDNEGSVTLIDYTLDGGPGVFTDTEHFAEPIKIKRAQLQGKVEDNLKQFSLKEMKLDFWGETLTMSGTATHHETGWSYDGLAVARDMPVNDLYLYWPKTLAPGPYTWVTTHIRKGVVPKAEARFKLLPEEIGLPFPEHALKVSILAQGAEVNYMQDHPRVKNVTGKVKFTGKAMEITSQKGSMLTGSRLKDAYLTIPDLTAPKAEMKIKLKVAAPASDVVSYLDIPDLGYAKPLALNAKTISGQMEGDLSFSFLLPAKHEASNEAGDLKFQIAASLKDVSQQGFLDTMNLSGVNGQLKISPEQVTFAGPVKLDDVPLEMSVVHDFHGQEFPTSYRVSGQVPVAKLGVFGVPPLDFIKGDVGVVADIQMRGTANALRVKADLTKAAAGVPEIGLNKPLGQSAELSFEALTGTGTLKVNRFDFQSSSVRAQGAMSLKDQMKTLEEIQFDRLDFAGNSLALNVRPKPGGYTVRMKGAALDLRSYFADKKKKAGSGKLPFNIDGQAEFASVTIEQGREIRNVNAQFACTPTICSSLAVRGTSGQNNQFSFQVTPSGGKRNVVFEAADAGSLFKAMDVYDDMNGGALSVRGSIDDSDPERPFSGTLHISEHKITNASILARISTLASVSGVADAAKGEGITLNKADANIKLTDDLLIITDGKAVGPSLGVSVERATIDRHSKMIEANGTFVPSYTLNTVVDKIPVIGDALTGGKGEGVFAANYTVKGIYPDVKVNVNALSMLAPGFVRNLFGKGHEPAEKPKPQAPKPQESLPGEKPASSAVPLEMPEAAPSPQPEAAAPPIPEAAPVITQP